MKTLIALTLLAVATLGCDPAKAKSLVPDINPCGTYRELGRDTAEDIWANDWQAFAPLWATEPDAEGDEQYCRGLISLNSDTPPVSLPSILSSPERAAITCRAAAIVVATARMGPKRAALALANPASRLAMLATAHALGNAILERHGQNALAAMEDQVRSFDELPEVSTTCVRRYFRDVRAALRARGGV